MDCREFQRSVVAVKTGRLEPSARREFDAHRAACPACDALARRSLRPPRLIAAGFLLAFAASIATLIYTGLLVRARDSPVEAPATSRPDAAPAAGDRERPTGRDPSGADAGDDAAAASADDAARTQSVAQ